MFGVMAIVDEAFMPKEVDPASVLENQIDGRLGNLEGETRAPPVETGVRCYLKPTGDVVKWIAFTHVCA